jgi:hypothetical protein
MNNNKRKFLFSRGSDHYYRCSCGCEFCSDPCAEENTTTEVINSCRILIPQCPYCLATFPEEESSSKNEADEKEVQVYVNLRRAAKKYAVDYIHKNYFGGQLKKELWDELTKAAEDYARGKVSS